MRAQRATETARRARARVPSKACNLYIEQTNLSLIRRRSVRTRPACSIIILSCKFAWRPIEWNGCSAHRVAARFNSIASNTHWSMSATDWLTGGHRRLNALVGTILRMASDQRNGEPTFFVIQNRPIKFAIRLTIRRIRRNVYRTLSAIHLRVPCASVFRLWFLIYSIIFCSDSMATDYPNSDSDRR